MVKTIVFDFDGTLTKKSNEIWTKMWIAIDALDIDKKLFKQYRNGEFDYVKWCQLIEDAYIEKGFNRDILLSIANDIVMMDNLEITFKTLKDKGYHLFIVSGGVKSVIYYKLGTLVDYFDGIYACDFVFDDENKLKKIVPTKYDEEGKKIFIDEYCLKTNTLPSEITFIGNGDNDEYVYKSGCRTICINPEKTTNHTNKTIWHNVIDNVEDMKIILDFLG